MIDSRVLYSLVLTVGDAFWVFDTANKGLAWQQVAITPGTNMAVLHKAWSLNVCAIFSNISDFGVYVHTMACYIPSHRLWRLDKPLVLHSLTAC